MTRTYSELRRLKTFEERYEYLKLSAGVGHSTFGFDRILNQTLYKSKEWKRIRDDIIIRDGGCDLGIEDREILDKIIVHHMNPISVQDILERKDWILNPEFLVCVSHRTHNAIHYGDESSLMKSSFTIRTKNDTCPWR